MSSRLHQLSKHPTDRVFASSSELLARTDCDQAFNTLLDSIRTRWAEGARAQQLALVGILRGGVPLAQHLAERLTPDLGFTPEVGELDITLYRDDAGTPGRMPRIYGTSIPFDVDGRPIILVDDVLASGRTVRAAMDHLMDFGRPSRIELAVLVDRGGRQLPIQADHLGIAVKIPAPSRVYVELSGTGAPLSVVCRS